MHSKQRKHVHENGSKEGGRKVLSERTCFQVTHTLALSLASTHARREERCCSVRHIKCFHVYDVFGSATEGRRQSEAGRVVGRERERGSSATGDAAAAA